MGRDAQAGGSGGGPRRREPLTEEVVELTAERLKVIAKVKSIALLDALKDGEATVQDLADRVGLAHQNASHHLALLRRAGILTRRTEGPATFYAIEDWSAWWVVEQMASLSRSLLEERDGAQRD
jgi:DNA-binding transcriptional ArsR family regulator